MHSSPPVLSWVKDAWPTIGYWTLTGAGNALGNAMLLPNDGAFSTHRLGCHQLYIITCIWKRSIFSVNVFSNTETDYCWQCCYPIVYFQHTDLVVTTHQLYYAIIQLCIFNTTKSNTKGWVVHSIIWQQATFQFWIFYCDIYEIHHKSFELHA